MWRVFASLATYTAKGYINQLESMRHKIADVAQSIVTIPDVASPKLAGDYTGDLSNAERTGFETEPREQTAWKEIRRQYV